MGPKYAGGTTSLIQRVNHLWQHSICSHLLLHHQVLGSEVLSRLKFKVARCCQDSDNKSRAYTAHRHTVLNRATAAAKH